MMKRNIVFDEFQSEIIHRDSDFHEMKAGVLASKVLDYIEPFIKKVSQRVNWINYVAALLLITTQYLLL